MKSERAPAGLHIDDVIARLARLRRLYVAETVADAHHRFERERPVRQTSLEVAAARRLNELRALDELTRHLHRRRPG